MYLKEEVKFEKLESAEIDSVHFELLYKHWSKMLQKYAYYYLKDIEVAETIVNDVFLQLWLKKKNPNHIKAYLYRSVKNSSLNYLTQQKRVIISYIETTTLEDISDNLPKSVESFEEEKLLFLEKIINKLPEKRQLVFKMFRLEGLSYADIAELLQISTRTVEDHLSKSMQFIYAHAKHLLHETLTES